MERRHLTEKVGQSDCGAVAILRCTEDLRELTAIVTFPDHEKLCKCLTTTVDRNPLMISWALKPTVYAANLAATCDRLRNPDQQRHRTLLTPRQTAEHLRRPYRRWMKVQRQAGHWVERSSIVPRLLAEYRRRSARFAGWRMARRGSWPQDALERRGDHRGLRADQGPGDLSLGYEAFGGTSQSAGRPLPDHTDR